MPGLVQTFGKVRSRGMNVFILIMLVFAAIGFFDKMAGGRIGLSEPFDKGLFSMGTMAIPVIGVSCAGVSFIQQHIDAIMYGAGFLPFDASMFAGILFAPDVGGYFIAEQLTDDETLVVFNSLVLGALLGQTITFQLPLFMSMVDKKDHSVMFRGFTSGIIVIPAGLAIAGLMLKMEMVQLAAQFIPVFVICLLMALGLAKRPESVVKGFSVFAQIIQTLVYIMFFVTVAGIFIPAPAYSDMASVHEALLVTFKCIIIMCGSLVMSELILRFFRKYIQKIAGKVGINEVAAVGILLGAATSIAMLPLFSRMDEKGKLLNSAFSVSGAYMLGGQMGFVANLTSGYEVAVFLAAKLACGLLSMFIAYKVYDRLRFDKE